jgi:RNA polymerase sigma factor (sigma-70 family)
MTATRNQPVREFLHQLAAAEAPDAELVWRFATQRDEAAFAALVTRHGPLVMRACRRVLPDASAADDAFQATFLVLARKAGAIRQQESLANWLYGVAIRVAMKARADAARRRARETQASLRVANEPMDEMSARELCAVLDEELLRLPERLRLPLLLCCMEGRTRDEVARELNWSVRTLARRLESGRELLRARLARRGVALPAALLAGSVAVPAASGHVPGSIVAAAVNAARADSGAIPAHIAALASAALDARGISRRLVIAAVIATLCTAGSAAALAYYNRGGAKTEEPPLAPPARPASGNSDPLPTFAIARFGTTRLRHQHAIVSLSFSRDGRRLASGSWDETARVWDFASGRELRVCSAGAPSRNDGGRAVSSVALSPDGTMVAMGDMDRTFTVWDVASGKELFRAAKLENTGMGVAFSPDGQYLAAASYGPIRVWNTKTWQERWQVAKTNGGARKVSFSPDGKLLAVLTDAGAVEVRDAASGELIDHFGGAKFHALFLPDGRTIATSVGRGKIALYDVKLRKETRRLEAMDDGDLVFAIHPGGKLFACAKDFVAIRLIDTATGQTLRTLERPENDDGISDLAFTPDGTRLAAAGHEKMIHVWDVESAKEIPPPPGHTAEVRRLCASADSGTLISAGEDGRIITWDRATGKPRHTDRVASKTNDIAISADGRLAAFAVKKQVRLWNRAANREIRTLAGHQGEVVAVAISPDAKSIATASWKDHTIRLWSAQDGAERIKIDLPTPNGVNYGDCPLVFSRDGRMLISGSADRANDALYYWDAATGKQLRSMKQQVSRLALSPDGRLLVSSGWDRRIHLWDAASATEIRNWASDGGAMAFSPDGRLLATGGTEGVVHVWELATGIERRRFAGHRSGGEEHRVFAAGVSALTFSADGRTIYSGGGDTTVLAWPMYAPAKPGADLASGWVDLAGDDPARIQAAIDACLADPRATAEFLKAKLAPIMAADPQTTARLIVDLDSSSFSRREHATTELEKLGESALPYLTDHQAQHLSAEGRRRVHSLLDRITSLNATPELRRQLRSMEVLELIGTAEARELIRDVAAGVPQARLTRDARAAADRMDRR